MFGLSFANPAMLHGLWVALAPILIHLLNRRRTVTVPFSNVALIQSLQHDRMRRVRIKQWLLLLLRTLLIALLALAFARPTLKEAAQGGGAHTSAVILVDRSLSMRYTGVFDGIRERLDETLSLFDSQDDVRVIVFDERAELVGDGTVADVRLAIRDLAPGYAATDVTPALEMAGGLLTGVEQLNREVFILSDFVAGGWLGIRDSIDGLQASTVFIVRPVERAGANVSVAELSVAGGLLGVGSRTSLTVTLVNHGRTARPEVGVDVSVDERRVARRLVSLAAGETLSVDVPFTPETGGDLVIRAELEASDDLVEDNVRRSVVHVPDRIRVTLVGSTNDRHFVEQVLAAEGDAVDVGVVDRLTLESVAESDVIVVWMSNPGSEIDVLAEHVETGGGLLMFLPPDVNTRIYNERFLPRILPGRLVGIEGRPGGLTHVKLKPPEDGHVVVRQLVDPNAFNSPEFKVRYRLEAGPGVGAILSYTDGAVALAESTPGDGRVLLLTSNTDPEWSDLALSGLFVPLVHRASRYLASGSFGRSDFVAGRSVTRPAAETEEREGQLVQPDGTVRAIWVEDRGERRIWDAGVLDTPGVYEIRSRGRRADRLAVNVAAEESETTRLGIDAISERLPGSRVVEVAAEETLGSVVRAHRRGREIWKPILLAALAILALELWIVGGEKRSREGEEGAKRPLP